MAARGQLAGPAAGERQLAIINHWHPGTTPFLDIPPVGILALLFFKRAYRRFIVPLARSSRKLRRRRGRLQRSLGRRLRRRRGRLRCRSSKQPGQQRWSSILSIIPHWLLHTRWSFIILAAGIFARLFSNMIFRVLNFPGWHISIDVVQ